ncbi:MAG: hypothetical protein LBK74_07150 [Treponema sp.]|jgi:hypothetical protein|nr:hypothetical protein [Treponema sp.]
MKCEAVLAAAGKVMGTRPARGALAFVIAAALAGTVFLCRRPVVLVGDRAFNLVYGEKRSRTRQLALSVLLFRPVRTVTLAGGAGPDLAAQAAAGRSRRPYGVFFPYRYREGARRYLRDRPGAPVVVLGGRPQDNRAEGPGEGPEPLWLYTDTLTDMYRAGAIAGVLAGEGTPGLYRDGLSEAERAAFSRGLDREGFLFSGPVRDAACVVLGGRGDEYFLEETTAPLVLFTWTDPALVPRTAAAVFDDSPWTQLRAGLEMLKKGEAEGRVPSEIRVFLRTKEQKEEYSALNRLKTLKYSGETADN